MANADKMDVNQTIMWLWTLAYSFCWSKDETERYLEKFRSCGIDGYSLSLITPEDLECVLNVKNPEHRRVIMLSIGKLFPEKFPGQAYPSYPENLFRAGQSELS